MLMASEVGEVAARQLHATELLMMLGTAIVLLVERPAKQDTEESERAAAEGLSLEQP